MRTYIIRRCLQSFIVFGAILIIVFSMLQITGNPAAVLMPLDSTEEDIQAFSKEMGFDQPIPIQFAKFMLGSDLVDDLLGADREKVKVDELERDPDAPKIVRTKGVIRGDFGFSYRHEIPAMGLVLEHFPNTVLLALAAVLIAVVISIPAGVLSATFRNTWIDYSSSVGAMFGQSMPNFWLGLLLIMLFAVNLGWLPVGGFVSPQTDPVATIGHLILPAITIGTAYAATIARMLRASMVDVLRRDYVLVARAMGLRPRVIVWRDAFRNALIPTVTVAGFAFGYMLAGTIITEVIFNIPGVGRMLYESILARDYPLVQGIVLFNVALFVVANFLVDVLYTLLDPRIGY